MYKPPENSNRVRAMKMKFESQEIGTSVKQNAISSSEPVKPKIKIHSLDSENNNRNTPSKLQQNTLNRQLSDPAKRNIKRTPAFRLDKNTFKEKDHVFHRHASCGSIKSKLDKFKLLDDSNCDINKNENGKAISNSTFRNQEDEHGMEHDIEENILKKSVGDINNSSINKSESEENASEILQSVPLALTTMLYSSPIPKSKRTKEKIGDELNEAIHKDSSTLKLTNSSPSKSSVAQSKIETAQNVIEILKNIDTRLNGTDTIKNALKRPLPAGPPPKKPPRTFQHSPQNSKTPQNLRNSLSKSELNISSLNIEDDFSKKLSNNLLKQMTLQNQPTKKDAKYMLEKLENALKNNKIKLQRQQKFEYSSDDEREEATKHKSSTNSPLLKRLNNANILSTANQKINFGCLNSLSCAKGTYTKINKPSSSFFLDRKSEEPIYAEPFQYDVIMRRGSVDSTPKKKDTAKEQRNSLYYMSSPVLGLEAGIDQNSNVQSGALMEQNNDREQTNNQCDTSSISTFSSDTDSNASTPAEFSSTHTNALVKDLIRSFEDKQQLDDKKIANGVDHFLRSKSARHLERDDPKQRYGTVCLVDRNATEEKVKREASKFEIYVKTVKTFSIKKMSNKHLFHCCLLVGLDERSPYIKSKFPPDIEVPAYIEKLCFPDSEDQRANYSAREQCYSLVITDASGDRIYGYCRRVLPEGSSACLPLAYCVLTKHRAPRFYKRILEELESHHGLPDKQRIDLVNEFYKLEFPQPGHSIRLDLNRIIRSEVKYYDTKSDKRDIENNNEVRKSDTMNPFGIVSTPCPHGIVNLGSRGNNDGTRDSCPICSEGNQPELVLALHQDMRYEETDLKELCETLDVGLLQKVFENLLLERKVIFISCNLSKLSSCIEAIQSVLYPFSWPHAFIPVLPRTRWEIVEAPAPLICGVLSVGVINEFKIENGIVVDLDSKEILLEVDDDEKILPDCSIKTLKKALSIANSIPTTDNQRNVLLSDAFLRVFIMTCGHYKDYISNSSFDKEAFKIFPKSKSIRRFLQWFTQTTMFDLFIDAVLSNPNSFSIFNNRITIYSSQDTTLILEKMKDWKRL